MPKKMRRLALRCLLSAKVRDGEFKVIDEIELAEPKTKEMVKILSALGADKSALLVTANADTNIIKSARNVPSVKTSPAGILSVVDLLNCRALLMTESAVRKAEELWGNTESVGGNDASL